MTPHDHDAIAAVGRILKATPSVLFITGAGLSADSGLPTYRGIGGLYDVDVTEEGHPIEVVLSGEMLESNPALTWKYLLQIADAAMGAAPNAAHETIAKIESAKPRVWTLTQNVDHLLHEAGCANVIEIHGNMNEVACMECGSEDLALEAVNREALPPRCDCGGVLRPRVVLFGERLPDEALSRLMQQFEIGFGLVISVGTSSLFPYITEPVLAAKRLHIPTVEINPGETSLSHEVDYKIALGAAAALPAIWGASQV